MSDRDYLAVSERNTYSRIIRREIGNMGEAIWRIYKKVMEDFTAIESDRGQ